MPNISGNMANINDIVRIITDDNNAFFNLFDKYKQIKAVVLTLKNAANICINKTSPKVFIEGFLIMALK